ncbi:uncharacterized protein LOC129594672 [Paramacrobiotus metropolitanus]|uniref:uncharacterized protein LOC129594672 n=1 Tax=Paramacrobiotus metropolitanus TaxID=2943436 RepID=UPI0024457067|nr:uncharacterized protein LOC129594672 [Paramacrobiotus metropolitanus]
MKKSAAGFLVVCLVHLVYVATESTEECAALQHRCFAVISQFPNITFPWPSTSRLSQPPGFDGIRFCNYSNVTGSCLRELRSRCPASSLTPHQASVEGWYQVLVNEAMAKSCTILDPIKFLAAKMHCDKQTNTTDFTVEVVLGEKIDEFISNANTEEKAQAALCRKIQDFLPRMGDPESQNRTPLYTDLVAKCGQDAIDTMEDAVEWTLMSKKYSPCKAQGAR